MSALRTIQILASVSIITLAQAGCITTSEKTGSLPTATNVQEADYSHMNEGAIRAQTQSWAARYEASPTDANAALNYALGLRALGQRAQAIAILQNAAIANPENNQILAAYGKLLSDVGRNKEAFDVLGRAHQPEQPNWRILSAQGVVLDQMGEHDEARRYYDTALRIVPNEPTILTNLGLSYVLSNKLKQAEETLELAVAQPQADKRVRQNLAVAYAMQGKFGPAEQTLSQILPPAEVAENMKSLRQMVSQKNTWKELGTTKSKPKS